MQTTCIRCHWVLVCMHPMLSEGVSPAKSYVIVKPLLLEQVIAIRTWELCMGRNIMFLSGVVHQTCFGLPDKVIAWLSAM